MQPGTGTLLMAVLAPLVTGLATMWLPRRAILARVLIAALGPLLSCIFILYHALSQGVVSVDAAVATEVWEWLPSLNLNISFFADGLGIFFGLLVAGIGTLVVIYARAYFGRDEADLFRFYPTLGFFTTAMLGIVLSDYLLLSILFWELTSISSFLLIGWDREDKRAVKLAMQAFFTTGLGGMALFGGILLFGMETDLWRWSELLREATSAEVLHDILFYADGSMRGAVLAAFGLMLLGAATKSAQWPWHYWLPGAMAAPTPVSTYLHSATMVKAGIFLTARMLPVFGELPVWPWFILVPGAITMLGGALIALNQHDLKRIFAYTTVSQLGLLMCAYGLGALSFEHGGHLVAAIDWDISQIANHALYKAPLFIVAGAIGHVAGTRSLPALFGFWKQNKAMVIVMILAGYALAGGPGTISFPAKELFFYAIYHAFEVHWIFKVLAVMAVLTAVCNVAIFIRLLTTLMGWKPGLRDDRQLAELAATGANGAGGGGGEHHNHGAGFWGAMLWVPAAIIVAGQYVGGLAPPVWNWVFRGLEANINYDVFAAGLPFAWQVHWGIPLIMSLIAFAGGITIGLAPLMRGVVTDPHDRIYPAMYWLCVTGGGRVFRTVQTGYFRHYLIVVLLALVTGLTAAVVLDRDMLRPQFESIMTFPPGLLLGLIICASALMMPMVQQRVVRVLVLGACGFSVVGMYLIYQAPDLALTQLMFELISVILFVLVLRMLPEPVKPRKSRSWIWRSALAGSVGLSIGWMTLLAAGTPNNESAVRLAQRLDAEAADDDPSRGSDLRQLGRFFAATSHEGTSMTGSRGGGGKNIVNVILVDFRGFDTLGEITVLSIAALGVWSLLPGRRAKALAAHERSGES